MYNLLFRPVLALLVLASVSGCSVYMAANQPDKKDLSVFDPGTRRVKVVAELGAPILTEERDGTKIDTFVFRQGYSSGARTSRALLHGAADVLTLGLWEVVGTPTEAVFDGTEVQVEVLYDENDEVNEVTVLEGQKALDEAMEPPISATPQETN